MSKVEDLWVENYNKNINLKNFDKSNVRSINTLIQTNTVYSKPVILVAAGPSLDKNIHILKEHQNKFIILCADVVLYRLIEENIQPDFICSIDPHPTIVKFFNGIDTSKLKLIAPTTTSSDIFDTWKGDIFLFNQYDTSSKEKQDLLKNLVKPTFNYGYITNMFFVGATLLQVATIFKPHNIYLLGYDFGFTDDKAYCKGFLDRKLIDVNNVGMDVLINRETVGDTEINGIKTTHTLCLYRNTFVKLVDVLSKNMRTNVTNCTEGGLLQEIDNRVFNEIVYNHNYIDKTWLGGLKKRKRKNKK